MNRRDRFDCAWACGFGLLAATLGVGTAWGSSLRDSSTAACRSSDPASREVRWIEPRREVDRFYLEQQCRTVGAPVLLESPASHAPPAMDSLVVVTWNIHVGGGDLIEFVARLRSGDWTEGRPVDDFVLLLQEVHRTGGSVPAWTPGFKTPDHIDASASDRQHLDIVETGGRLGLHTFYAPSMRNGGEEDPREDRGNAILSTLALHERTVIVLPFEGQRRAAVTATVHGVSRNGGNWTLRVCSAHLDAHSKGLRTFASLGAGRARQARFLVDNLDTLATVLGGDFNTWTTGFRELSVKIMRDAFPLPTALSKGATLNQRLLYDMRVDYMFFRLGPEDDATYRRIDERFDSDHHPLISTVPVLNLPP